MKQRRRIYYTESQKADVVGARARGSLVNLGVDEVFSEIDPIRTSKHSILANG
jgi:hypothetical protein